MLLNIFIVSGDDTEHKSLHLTDRDSVVLNSKLDFLRFVFAGSGVSGMERFELTRLSKRHKNYVPLTTKSDFRELKRSLKVKNHATILVFANERNINQIEGLNGLKMLSFLIESFSKSYEKLMRPDGEMPQVCHDELSSCAPLALTKCVHQYISCNACDCQGLKFINGVRYKCVVCNDYDLCSICFLSGKDSGPHKESHPMIAISSPNDLKRWGLELINESPQKAMEEIMILQKTQLPRKLQSNKDNDMHLDVHSQENDNEAANLASKPFIEKEYSEGESNVLKETNLQESINHALIKISLKASGKLLMQVEIKNIGDMNADLNGYTLNFTDANGCVSSTVIEHGNIVKPGRCFKLNVRLSHANLQYPLNVSVSEQYIKGECQFGSMDESQIFALKDTVSDGSPIDIYSEMVPAIKKLEVSDSAQSLILPKLAKELHNSSSELMNVSNESPLEEDYDVISMTDADELLSDFEIVPALDEV